MGSLIDELINIINYAEADEGKRLIVRDENSDVLLHARGSIAARLFDLVWKVIPDPSTAVRTDQCSQTMTVTDCRCTTSRMYNMFLYNLRALRVPEKWEIHGNTKNISQICCNLGSIEVAFGAFVVGTIHGTPECQGEGAAKSILVLALSGTDPG